MRDEQRTNEQTLKIELLSQWKLEAEFRNKHFVNLYVPFKLSPNIACCNFFNFCGEHFMFLRSERIAKEF